MTLRLSHVSPEPVATPMRDTMPRPYAARLDIDYPERLGRASTFFRLIWVIPFAVILGLLTATGNQTVVTEPGERIASAGWALAGGIGLATALMISFGKILIPDYALPVTLVTLVGEALLLLALLWRGVRGFPVEAELPGPHLPDLRAAHPAPLGP